MNDRSVGMSSKSKESIKSKKSSKRSSKKIKKPAMVDRAQTPGLESSSDSTEEVDILEVA